MSRDFEERLGRLREEALASGAVAGHGVDVSGGPIPRPAGKPGYYGEGVVRPPVWTWEIPVYFFIGGASGMAPVIACAAFLFRQPEVARSAMWIAAFGALISPVLLILDLGRPRLFLNMLRVFKWRSVMSVGAWILFFFSPCAVGGLIALELNSHHVFGGGFDRLFIIVGVFLTIAAAFWGLGLATYTGVLLGATAIPAWLLHRVLLPIHFGTAGLGTAAAVLELLGHHIRPLNAIGFVAAGIETLLLIWLELDKHGAADRALHEGTSGWMLRIAEILTGPLSLILRIFGAIPFAGVSFALGALLSRLGWIEAGRVSGRDPEAVFTSQNGTTASIR